MIKGEFYEEKIKEIEDGKTSIAIYNGKPEACKCSCHGCERLKSDVYNTYCSDLKFIEWYSSEYITPIKITKRQKQFLESLSHEDGWLFRDDYDDLCYQDNTQFEVDLSDIEAVIGRFEFIKYEDNYSELSKNDNYIRNILKNAEVVEE